MGTTSSTSKSNTKGGDPAGAKAPSGSSSAARAAKRAAMAQPTLKNVRKVQDIYDMKSVLGTGGYAVVWSAVHKATKEEYAIKVMKATASASPKDDEVTVDEIRNEIEVMKKLEHPNIIYVKEYFVQSGKFYIVMSACAAASSSTPSSTSAITRRRMPSASRSNFSTRSRTCTSTTSHTATSSSRTSSSRGPTISAPSSSPILDSRETPSTRDRCEPIESQRVAQRAQPRARASAVPTNSLSPPADASFPHFGRRFFPRSAERLRTSRRRFCWASRTPPRWTCGRWG